MIYIHIHTDRQRWVGDKQIEVTLIHYDSQRVLSLQIPSLKIMGKRGGGLVAWGWKVTKHLGVHGLQCKISPRDYYKLFDKERSLNDYPPLDSFLLKRSSLHNRLVYSRQW